MNFFNNLKLNKFKFIYARSYLYEYPDDFKIYVLKNKSKCVTLLGVPDGIYYRVDAALSINKFRRLYYCSNELLDNRDLYHLDTEFGKKIYPIINKSTTNFIPITSIRVGINFYLSFSDNFMECSNLSKFIEYKFLEYRNVITNCFYTFTENGEIKSRNLILPKNVAQLVLIMPENFQRTSLKSGFFRWNNNLTLRIYSKCILSGKNNIIQDDNLVSVIDTYDKISNNFLKSILFRLGFFKIYIFDKKIIAEDNLLIAVIGDIDHFYNFCSQ